MATQSPPPPPFRARDTVALSGAEVARAACISIWIRERSFDFYGGRYFRAWIVSSATQPCLYLYFVLELNLLCTGYLEKFGPVIFFSRPPPTHKNQIVAPQTHKFRVYKYSTSLDMTQIFTLQFEQKTRTSNEWFFLSQSYF